MSFDWKFVVATLATIAGIFVPVWLWQADISARSLSVRLASSIALQPTEATSIPDIQISIDGVNIKSPFLSTLVLSNDGSKPVTVSDYESPIELSVGQDTQIVRARISSVEPHNLKAELDTSKQSVKLRPLLLNPDDTLTIAIITSGGSPSFDARARIAGISKVKFEDGTMKKEGWVGVAKYIAITLLSLFLYVIYSVAFIRPTSVRLGRMQSITTVLLLGFLASYMLNQSIQAAGVVVSKNERLFVAIVLGFIAGFIVVYLLKKKPA